MVSPRHPYHPSSNGFVRGVLFGLLAGSGLVFVSAHVAAPGDFSNPAYVFTNVYLIIGLFAGTAGLVKLWGGQALWRDASSKVGVTFCSGLILWGVGQAVWIVQAQSSANGVPYPGFADIFYVLSMLCWLAGLFYLYEAHRIPPLSRISALGALLAISVSGIGALVTLRHHETLLTSPTYFAKFVLDLAYGVCPMLICGLVLALLIGRRASANARFRRSLQLILVASALDLIGNVMFALADLWEPPIGYYNGGWIDWVFAIAMYLWALACFEFLEQAIDQIEGDVQLGNRGAARVLTRL